MGSPPSEPHHRPDEAQVTVRLRRGFWMARYEVTQGQWRATMGAWPSTAPSAQFGLGDAFPMYWVNYPQAEAFCAAATVAARRAQEIEEGWAFALPTEAQWEYACRAGTTTASAFGEVLTSEAANIVDPAAVAAGRPNIGRACEVGRYRPNAWGLHDMHGNVFEWCRDWYHARLPGGDDPDLTATRGVPNRDGSYSRVRRGGAWNDEARFCRSALRLRYEPERDSDHIGFRVVLVEGYSGVAAG
jgi:sulfatase modifying factor 1